MQHPRQGRCFFLKIDFNLWPVEALLRVADEPELPDELDVGYIVLLDKDRVTARLNQPTYQAQFITTTGMRRR